MKINWSSLWKKEDWWAVWIGFIIISLAIFKLIPHLPVIQKWDRIAISFPDGFSTLGSLTLLFLLLLILTAIATLLMRNRIRQYIGGFAVVFCLSFLALWIGKYVKFATWGLEAVLWALILGLVIGNLMKVPEWLRAAIQAEFFIKIGLVLLGAEILFSTLARGGLLSIGQALLVVLIVWFVAYLIARKFGLDKDFASILASGVSICGVSAAIAAGGAIKGNPKHVSYVISLVLLVAMPMLILMPLFSHLLGLTPAVAGAWIGGTIDTTAAVAAAGTLVDPETGLQVATLVKMAQNVLIGFAAFFLAIWSTFTTSKNSTAGKTNERIRLIDIWFRLPKFILGFIIASAIFSFIVEPTLGDKVTGSILGITRGYREWFFALAFVSIGLDTRIRELIVAGRGKPAMAFISAQLFNIMWAFLIAWLLWSGKLFASPLG